MMPIPTIRALEPNEVADFFATRFPEMEATKITAWRGAVASGTQVVETISISEGRDLLVITHVDRLRLVGQERRLRFVTSGWDEDTAPFDERVAVGRLVKHRVAAIWHRYFDAHGERIDLEKKSDRTDRDALVAFVRSLGFLLFPEGPVHVDDLPVVLTDETRRVVARGCIKRSSVGLRQLALSIERDGRIEACVTRCIETGHTPEAMSPELLAAAVALGQGEIPWELSHLAKTGSAPKGERAVTAFWERAWTASGRHQGRDLVFQIDHGRRCDPEYLSLMGNGTPGFDQVLAVVDPTAREKECRRFLAQFKSTLSESAAAVEGELRSTFAGAELSHYRLDCSQALDALPPQSFPIERLRTTLSEDETMWTMNPDSILKVSVEVDFEDASEDGSPFVLVMARSADREFAFLGDRFHPVPSKRTRIRLREIVKAWISDAAPWFVGTKGFGLRFEAARPEGMRPDAGVLERASARHQEAVRLLEAIDGKER